MLYCLSKDVYEDLVFLRHHDSCNYDETNSCLLTDVVPDDCQFVDKMGLIVSAVAKLYKNNNWQYATIMLRSWVSTVYPFSSNVVDLNFKYKNQDEGYWEYTYASMGAKKLYISESMYSKDISVSGGVPHYRIDDGLSVKEYTLAEIEKSNQYFKYAAVFPANPRMFADDNVEFMIPYSLIQ